MYLIAGLFLALCVIFLLINRWQKRSIIRKVRCMDFSEKLRLLNKIIEPFGFSYDACENIFLSTIDAWQRHFGYRALFDRAASRFNMVFDCEPVYFDYDGRTWLIEFWKGQYGINTGAEIGIYHADKLLAPDQYASAQFDTVSEQEMLPLSMKLERRSRRLFTCKGIHWWLAGFRMGTFTPPQELVMHVSLTFPDMAMMHSFLKSLQAMGYDSCNFCACDRTVSFAFTNPHTRRRGFLLNLRNELAQWQNQWFVRLYCRITHPFAGTVDRLLYLYYFLPFAFRRIVGIRRCLKKEQTRYRHSRFFCENRSRL